MNIDSFVKTHGFWFACSAEQEIEAKENPNLMPLSDVFIKMGLPVGPADGFYVPKYFAEMNKKDELPVWVWRKCDFEYRPIQKGDYAHWIVPPGMSVLVKIVDIRVEQRKYEVCAVGSNHCAWVPFDSIEKVNG